MTDRSIPVRTIRVPEEPESGRFHIRRVEDILNGGSLQHKLHRHDFYFLLLIIAGAGIHEIDFKSFPVTGNTISCCGRDRYTSSSYRQARAASSWSLTPVSYVLVTNPPPGDYKRLPPGKPVL